MKDVHELQGRISNQVSLEYLNKHAEIFSIPELGIVLTSKGSSIPAGQHVHESYEFLLPIDQPFSAIIDNTRYILNGNALFPINSEQYHGPENSMNNFHCLTIDINKEYLCGMSKTLFGQEDISFENTNFSIRDTTRLLLQLYIDEHKNRQTGYHFILQSLANCITVDLIRHYKNNKIMLHNDKKYLDKKHILLVTDFLHENYMREYSMDDLAKIANYSPYHLIRIFKDTTGKTPYEYLMDIKIKEAQTLLKNTNKPVMEICYECGFNSPNHFNHVFKRRTGITPSKYRKTSICKIF